MRVSVRFVAVSIEKTDLYLVFLLERSRFVSKEADKNANQPPGSTLLKSNSSIVLLLLRPQPHQPGGAWLVRVRRHSQLNGRQKMLYLSLQTCSLSAEKHRVIL